MIDVKAYNKMQEINKINKNMKMQYKMQCKYFDDFKSRLPQTYLKNPVKVTVKTNK